MTGKETLVKLMETLAKGYDKLWFFHNFNSSGLEVHPDWITDGIIYEVQSSLNNPEIYGDARNKLVGFLNTVNEETVFNKTKELLHGLQHYAGTMYTI